MRWFEQLKQSFHRRTPAGPPAETWRLDPHPQLTWRSEHFTALLHAEQLATICYADCRDADATVQTVLLGFDIASNQLLLDNFVPALPIGLIDKPLTLKVPSVQGVLHLELMIVEKLAPQAGSALVAQVTAISTAANSQTSTIRFAKGHSPPVELLLPMNPLLRGNLLELSPTGLLLSASASSKPVVYTANARCSVLFDTRFRFTCAASVKRLRFRRKPFHHALVGLTFTELTEEHREQLGSFIAQSQSTEAFAHRAA